MNFKWCWDAGRALRAIEARRQSVERAAAEFMADRARKLAPVDTGFLVSTIDVTAPAASDHVHVVCTAPYAVFVNFGHFTKGGAYVKAQPFMSQSLQDTAAAFPEIAREAWLRVPGDASQHLGASIPKS